MTEKKQQIRDYLAITVGTILIAFAIKNIFDPVSMVTGGVSGAAIILKELWQVPLWLTNTVLNIPLFLAAFRMMGWQFIGRTLYSTAMLSAALYVLPEMGLVKEDMILSALFGGVLSGVGTGLVFLGGCTTGGTDMMAALIQKYMRHYSIAQIMQFIDGLIVIVGMYVFGIQRALYAIIAVYLVTKVSDSLIEGLKFSKQTFIVTEKPDEVARVIMEDLDRGATGICGKGMYSGQEKTIIFCVVNKKEIVKLKELVDDIDPNAFVIVSDAREVHGEGFIEKN